MNHFNAGPFVISPASRGMTVGGKPCLRWTLSYASEEIAVRTLSEGMSQQQIHDQFVDDIGAFIDRARKAGASDRVELIDFDTGDAVAHLFTNSICGMTPGLIDDRSRYWIRSADRLYSRDVTLTDFAALAVENSAPQAAWICGLLPDEILTSDPAQWRAPTSWEIRHVVGEGSFTGLSGAKAAELIGVTASNFRKYTARDGASTRQNMSFAMWHLLLHKLGVKRA